MDEASLCSILIMNVTTKWAPIIPVAHYIANLHIQIAYSASIWMRPMSATVHPVDEVLPAPRMVALGLQHVLVMYANAVAVPLILGGALHLPKDQLALLINADLFACGIATLVQTIGFGPFGIRLPVIMGVTAVAISPMLAMAAMPGLGLTGIYGARSLLAGCLACWWRR